MNLANVYAKFRGSPLFLYILSGFVAAWLALHVVFVWFDKDLGIINLMLSTEASVSLAFFAMLQERQDKRFEAMLQKIDDVVDDVLEEVTEDKENNGTQSS